MIIIDLKKLNKFFLIPPVQKATLNIKTGTLAFHYKLPISTCPSICRRKNISASQ